MCYLYACFLVLFLILVCFSVCKTVDANTGTNRWQNSKSNTGTDEPLNGRKNTLNIIYLHQYEDYHHTVRKRHLFTEERNNCYYQGIVRGINGSKVIANTCNGLKGSIILPDEVLMIEPLKNGSHYIYRSQDIDHTPKQICAYDNITHHSSSIFRNYTLFYAEMIKFREDFMKQVSNSEKKFVELLVVADNAAFTKYGTKTALTSHIKEVVNYVDGFFQELDVRVILSHIEVWNNGDKIPVSGNAESTLIQLARYRFNQLRLQPSSSPWAYTDTVHLLHGGDLNGNTLGIAYVGTMCRLNAVAVDQDSRTSVNVASTITHEMGHTFGMEHDGEECFCPEEKECIMSSSTSFSKPQAWSSCSNIALQQNLNLGLGNCLFNVPDSTQMVGGPQCGNDIVEQGEECDCGNPDQCRSQCCNPNTCRFEPGAVCDAGLCCQNCHLVRVGVKCRTEANECDLPEYCTGNSPHCPDNAYKEDGTKCEQDTAACSGGVCLTHDMLCETIWGEGATKAEEICYNVINVLGTEHGNCGHDMNGNYVKCAAKDVRCGKLYCSGGRNLPMIGSMAIRVTISDRYLCKGIGSSSNKSDSMDPGIVRSGTTCGYNKVCTDTMCQDIPPLECTQSCNDNGVCNNFGNCHCNQGFAPPHCNETGRGGSLDSGLYNENTVAANPPFLTVTTTTDGIEGTTISSFSVSGLSTSAEETDIRQGPLDNSTFSAAEIVLIIISVIAGAALLGVVALKVYYEIPGLSDKARSSYIVKEEKENVIKKASEGENLKQTGSIKNASKLTSKANKSIQSDQSNTSSSSDLSSVEESPPRRHPSHTKRTNMQNNQDLHIGKRMEKAKFTSKEKKAVNSQRKRPNSSNKNKPTRKRSRIFSDIKRPNQPVQKINQIRPKVKSRRS